MKALQQALLFGGSVPVEQDGEKMGKRRRVVLSEIVHARVSRRTAQKLKSAARENKLTVSKLLSRLLESV